MALKTKSFDSDDSLDSTYQRNFTSLGEESPTVTDSETKDSCPFSVDTNIASNDSSSIERVHNISEGSQASAEMVKGLKVKPASHFSYQCSALLSKPCEGRSLGQPHSGENKPMTGCGDGRSSTLPRKSVSQSHQLTSSDNVLCEPATSRTNIVRMLTQNFQMQLNQHHLHQAILKGSMAPKGTTDNSSLNEVMGSGSFPENSRSGFNVGKINTETNRSSSIDLGNLSSTPVAKCASTPKSSERILPKPDKASVVHDSSLLPGTDSLRDDGFEQHSRNFEKGDCRKQEKTGKHPKGKLNESTNDTSGHQAFLDEIMLVHAQILQRSKGGPLSGTTYQSPVVQLCHGDLTDPKSDAPQEWHITTLARDGKASGDLSYLSDDLDDSFWNLFPDMDKFEHRLGAAEQMIPTHQEKTLQLSAECSERNGVRVDTDTNLGAFNSLIPEANICANLATEGKVNEEILSGNRINAHPKCEVFEKPDTVNVTFTCKSPNSDLFTTVTYETIEISTVNKVQSLEFQQRDTCAAGGDNLTTSGAGDLDNMAADIVGEFDFLEFYIDDDFVYEERVKSTVAAAKTIQGTPPADSASTFNNPVEKEAAHNVEMTSTLNNPAEKEATHNVEMTCLLGKPPLGPCKSFTLSNVGRRGNMSQSALTEEEKLKAFPLKRCKSEKDAASSDAQPLLGLKSSGIKKGAYLIPKAREGIPVKPLARPCTPTNSLKPGKSDPSVSHSLADDRKMLWPNNDDDTLVEVDSDTIADDVAPLTHTDLVNVPPFETKDKTSVSQGSPSARAPTSKSNRLIQVNLKNQTLPKEAYARNDNLQNHSLLKDVCVRSGEDLNADDGDPWVGSQLRRIQEKIRRRKARVIYLVSSDDDTDNDADSEVQMSSSESCPLPLKWEISDLPLDVTDHAPFSRSSDGIDKQRNAAQKSVENVKDTHPWSGQLNVETQSVGTSTTGLQYKKHKKKSSCHHNRIPQNDKVTEDIAPDRQLETRPPSILRKSSQPVYSFCKDSDKMGAPSPLPRMKSNLSASHGSRSSDRIISFKDLRESDEPRLNSLKPKTEIIPPLALNEEAASSKRPIPAERNHGHYSSTVTTWLERQNFEESISLRSPCLDDGCKSTLDDRCISKPENETSRRTSKHDFSQKPFSAHSASKKKSDLSLSKPRQSTHQPVSLGVSRRAEEDEKDSHNASKDKPDGLPSKHRGSAPQSRKNGAGQDAEEHCVTLELNTPGRFQSKTKNATQLSATQLSCTGLHRFYIPRDIWPNGCRTRLDVRPSTTHPDCQRVTTTALNTATGQSETLLDQIISTRRLRTTIQID
ncbi:hypothetical protein Btru_031374 [Bulinus truncatus]|nr:hypothetical protein Btru_031374 [Bulinus truncatus]